MKTMSCNDLILAKRSPIIAITMLRRMTQRRNWNRHNTMTEIADHWVSKTYMSPSLREHERERVQG